MYINQIAITLSKGSGKCVLITSEDCKQSIFIHGTLQEVKDFGIQILKKAQELEIEEAPKLKEKEADPVLEK